MSKLRHVAPLQFELQNVMFFGGAGTIAPMPSQQQVRRPSYVERFGLDNTMAAQGDAADGIFDGSGYLPGRFVAQEEEGLDSIETRLREVLGAVRAELLAHDSETRRMESVSTSGKMVVL